MILWLLAIAASELPVLAQTFADFPIPVSWPGISTTCAEALNTTVSCSAILGEIAEEYVLFSASMTIDQQFKLTSL